MGGCRRTHACAMRTRTRHARARARGSDAAAHARGSGAAGVEKHMNLVASTRTADIRVFSTTVG